MQSHIPIIYYKNQECQENSVDLEKISRIRWNMNEDAVSAVFGMMLMLTVTIIIAAVISAYRSDWEGPGIYQGRSPLPHR